MINKFNILYKHQYKTGLCKPVLILCYILPIGETARACFENVKKRYLKRRNEYKKVANKSGTSTAIVDRANRELQLYSFLFWLDDYLKPRKTKSNVKDEIVNNVEDKSTIEEYDSDDQSTTQHLRNTPDDSSDNQRSEKRKISKKESVSSKAKKHKELSLVEEKQLAIMNQMEKDLAEDKEKQDQEYYYAQSIAAELRSFSESERFMVKHEINNVIFKYQMRKHAHGNMNPSNLSTPNFQTQSRPSSRSSNESSWSNHYPVITQDVRNFVSSPEMTTTAPPNSNLCSANPHNTPYPYYYQIGQNENTN